MNRADQIVCIFTDPSVIWFVHGVVLRDGTSEVKATYWKTGKVRNVATFSNGFRDGISISYTPSGAVSSYRHYRSGDPYGEAAVADPQGGLKKHVLASGVREQPYSPDEATKFGGYVLDDDKAALGKKYHAFGPGKWYG